MKWSNFKELPYTTPGLVWVKNLQSQCIWVSQIWAQSIGYKNSQDILGLTENDIKLFDGNMIEQFYKHDRKAFKNVGWYGAEETTLLGIKKITTFITKTPTYDDNNQICGLVCIVTSIPSLPQLTFLNN